MRKEAGRKYHSALKYAISMLRDKSYKIAVVGEFSSGKLTFLNAVMGKDYLLHSVSETTATIIREIILLLAQIYNKLAVIKFF